MKNENNKNEVKKMIGSISQTKDYDWFSFYPGNRDIVEEFLRRLNKVMRERPLPIPIIVNEHGQIIDGQCRFEAAKKLGMGINFMIIEGTGIQDTKMLNIHQLDYPANESEYPEITENPKV